MGSTDTTNNVNNETTDTTTTATPTESYFIMNKQDILNLIQLSRSRTLREPSNIKSYSMKSKARVFRQRVMNEFMDKWLQDKMLATAPTDTTTTESNESTNNIAPTNTESTKPVFNFAKQPDQIKAFIEQMKQYASYTGYTQTYPVGATAYSEAGYDPINGTGLNPTAVTGTNAANTKLIK